jgi:hypothetical protein
MSRQVGCLLALAICLSAFAGCGGSDEPKLYTVTGQVMFQGGPLPGAQVTFVPDKGPVALGTTDNDGKFTLRTGVSEGCVEGTCRVAVVLASAGSNDLAATMSPEDMQRMAMEGKLNDALKKSQKSLIPEKFNRADSSGLQFTVEKSGENNFTIDLK